MKCVVCDKPAKWRWSPDLDIRGIGSCNKHKKDVQIAYVMLITGDQKMYFSFVKSLRKKASGK